MVKGLDIFYDYFSEYTDQYVLIGGAACDLSFHNNNIDFRATKDLDMVLVVEAQTKEFAQRFWEFIQKGEYRNRARSNGENTQRSTVSKIVARSNGKPQVNIHFFT